MLTQANLENRASVQVTSDHGVSERIYQGKSIIIIDNECLIISVTESVMATDQLLWVSPDHDRVAHVQYPGPGGNVSVRVVELSSGGSTWSVSAPVVPRGHVSHVSSITWARADTLVVAWLDRSQTEVFYSTCPLVTSGYGYRCNIVSGSKIFQSVTRQYIFLLCILGWHKWQLLQPLQQWLDPELWFSIVEQVWGQNGRHFVHRSRSPSRVLSSSHHLQVNFTPSATSLQHFVRT